MDSPPTSDPVLDMVRSLPWHEEPVPNNTTAIVNPGIPAINITFARSAKDPKLREENLKDLHEVLSVETVAELTKFEDQIFEKLAADPSRAIHLLTDPLNTLQDLGVKLTPSATAELQNVRQKMITPQVLQALAAIKQLSIKVEGPFPGGQ